MTPKPDSPPPPERDSPALNYLIGQVMKKTKGRANPQLVRAMLLERLHPPAPPEAST